MKKVIQVGGGAWVWALRSQSPNPLLREKLPHLLISITGNVAPHIIIFLLRNINIIKIILGTKKRDLNSFLVFCGVLYFLWIFNYVLGQVMAAAYLRLRASRVIMATTTQIIPMI